MKLGTKLVNKVRARQNARKLLIQALYSLEVGGSDAAQIEEDCLAEKNMSRVDEKFFQTAFMQSQKIQRLLILFTPSIWIERMLSWIRLHELYLD